MNRGYTCIKGRQEPSRLYHPDRLKYPLKRSGGRGEGKWQRISWDEALDGIAQALTRVREKHGSDAIASIHGTGPRRSLCSALFPYALGSPNRISIDLHICFAPSLVAEGLTFGESSMMEQGPDYPNSECILVWGANPVASHPARGREILEAVRRRGAKLIVVDPRRTALARQATLWLPVRPGTDDALALGMMHVIVERQLYDDAFVREWCTGFDQVEAHVKDFPPARVESITGISAQLIEEAAKLYAVTKPAALHHRVAVEHNTNSLQTDRALAMLIALTGNLDIAGGNLLGTHVEGYIPSIALAGAGPWLQPSVETQARRIGAKEYPLVAGSGAILPFVPSPMALDAIEYGKPYPLRALYCAGANPVVNVQDSKRVWRLFKESLDLFVVADFFMTPSAELADFVLPAASWLERDECCDLSYLGYIAARQKVVEPLYESWDDLKILIELMKRIPWADRTKLPWDTVEECNSWMVRGMGISFEQFAQFSHVEEEVKHKRYQISGFNTASGKVELYSAALADLGYPGLPDYQEPPQSPISTPELYAEYPLILITGSRSLNFFHSEGRQIEGLRILEPQPQAEIHPDTAAAYGIRDGELVSLETPLVPGEKTRFQAKLTKDISVGLVHVPHGWWFPERSAPEYGCFDSNPNVVISGSHPRDRSCASIPSRGTLCRVSSTTVSADGLS